MYFDFEDYRPDTPTLDRSLTQLEIVLLTIVVHLLILISILAWPHLRVREGDVRGAGAEARGAAREGTGGTCATARSSCSSRRRSRSGPRCRRSSRSCRIATGGRRRWRRRRIRRTTWRSRAAIRRRRSSATRRRKSRSLRSSRARRRRRNGADNGAAPPADPNALRLPSTPDSIIARNEPSRNPTLGGPSPGVISEAVRNVQKYSQGESLQNVQGNGDFGPSIQFDTKGVDFGPWLRRFVAQIRRNWFVPYAAMSLRGHVVLSFKVHRDGSITDLQVMQPVVDRRVHEVGVQRDQAVEPDRAAAARVPRRERAVHRHVLLQRNAARRRAVAVPTRTQQIGLFSS